MRGNPLLYQKNFFTQKPYIHIPFYKKINNQMKKLLLLFIAVLLLNFAAYSQEENSDTTNKVTFSMDEIVVSAKKWGQIKTDVSFPITTLSNEEMLFRSPQTAADLLGITNKVFIQKSQQGGGSPMIRGFATNRLLYTVDGVRMNTAIFRAGNIQNVISLDPFSIEKTEVVFGAAPVVYGSDGIGGVMAFQTLTPIFSYDDEVFIKGSAAVRYSSANQENTKHFDVNLGWNNFASLTSISYNNFGDLRMGSKGPKEYLRNNSVIRMDNKDVIVSNYDPLVQTPTGYEQYYIMQKFIYKMNEYVDYFAGIHISETSNHSRYDRLIRERNNAPQFAEWYYGPQKWQMYNLGWNINRDVLLFDNMKFICAIQKFEESRNDRSFNNDILHSRTEEVDVFSADVDFYKILNDKTSLYYGVEGVTNNVKSTGIDTNILEKTTAPAASRYPQANWTSIGIYVSSDYKLSDITKLDAGVRYNYYLLEATFDTTFYSFPFTEAKINNGALTANLGLTFKPANDWIFQTNLSTAFRSPNVDDMGKVFDSRAGFVTVPNPDLKAEYAYNGSLGITKLFGSNAKINLNTYYTHLDNAMVIRDFQLNGLDSIMYDGNLSRVQAVQNAANAYVYGFDADIELKLSSFFFSIYGNYQIGKEELDNGNKSPLRHAPPFFGKASFGYNHQKIKMNLFVSYASEISNENMPEEEKGKPEIYAIDNNGNPYCPSWLTLNFRAEYKLNDIVSIIAGLDNILDARYRPYSSGIVSAGRNFVISLVTRF